MGTQRLTKSSKRIDDLLKIYDRGMKLLTELELSSNPEIRFAQVKSMLYVTRDLFPTIGKIEELFGHIEVIDNIVESHDYIQNLVKVEFPDNPVKDNKVTVPRIPRPSSRPNGRPVDPHSKQSEAKRKLREDLEQAKVKQAGNSMLPKQISSN